MIKEYLKDLKIGFKILFSKEFWKDFIRYYSSIRISKSIDKFNDKLKKL